MRKYIIYGKAKNTIYSIVHRGLEEANQKAELLKKIVQGEEFYIVESVSNNPLLQWDSNNTDEMLKGAIKVS